MKKLSGCFWIENQRWKSYNFLTILLKPLLLDSLPRRGSKVSDETLYFLGSSFVKRGKLETEIGVVVCRIARRETRRVTGPCRIMSLKWPKMALKKDEKRGKAENDERTNSTAERLKIQKLNKIYVRLHWRCQKMLGWLQSVWLSVASPIIKRNAIAGQ